MILPEEDKTMPISIKGFHHAGVLVTDLNRACRFYEEVMGLTRLPRPNFDFTGCWYDLGNGHQLHLLCVDQMPGHHEPARNDRHLALDVADIEATERTLRELGIEVASGSGRAGRPQLFIRDPDGNAIELRPA
jgi:glyoxylase I family protein